MSKDSWSKFAGHWKGAETFSDLRNWIRKHESIEYSQHRICMVGASEPVFWTSTKPHLIKYTYKHNFYLFPAQSLLLRTCMSRAMVVSQQMGFTYKIYGVRIIVVSGKKICLMQLLKINSAEWRLKCRVWRWVETVTLGSYKVCFISITAILTISLAGLNSFIHTNKYVFVQTYRIKVNRTVLMTTLTDPPLSLSLKH